VLRQSKTSHETCYISRIHTLRPPLAFALTQRDARDKLQTRHGAAQHEDICVRLTGSCKSLKVDIKSHTSQPLQTWPEVPRGGLSLSLSLSLSLCPEAAQAPKLLNLEMHPRALRQMRARARGTPHGLTCAVTIALEHCGRSAYAAGPPAQG
jgi:hypothetical protein